MMAGEDVEDAGAQLEQLNISDGTKHDTKATSTPRVNFPLPREIRDHIYGYLLCHEYVHEAPHYTRDAAVRDKDSKANIRKWSSAQTYRFHTNILAVNHEIHGEALEALKTNKFVAVSCTWPDADGIKHVLGLPIITENYDDVETFRMHVLRVHFRAPPRVIEWEHPTTASFLIVTEELPALCSMLKYLLATIQTSAPCVTHIGDQPDNYCCADIDTEGQEHRFLPALKIRVEISQDHHICNQLTKSWLEPFKTVIFGRQNVEVLNVCQGLTWYAQTLKQTMSPRSIWTVALAWQIFEMVRELKGQGDKFFRDGDKIRASVRYQAVWQLFDMSSIFHFGQPLYSPEVAEIVALVHCIVMTCAIKDNMMSIQQGVIDSHAAKARMDVVRGTLDKLLTQPAVARKVPTFYSVLSGWMSMLNLFLLHRIDQTLIIVRAQFRHQARGATGSIRQCIEHDLARVEDIINNGELREQYFASDPITTRLHCMSASVSTLGFPMMIGEKIHELQRPANISGLIDRAHYDSLLASNPEKAAGLL